MKSVSAGAGAVETKLEFGKELSDEELVQFFWNRKKASESTFAQRRKKAKAAADMYAGYSLSRADTEHLKKTERIKVDWPMAAGVVDGIYGAELAQRAESIFRGVDEGFPDSVIADWVTQLVKHYSNLCAGHREEASAYMDKLLFGYGYCEAYIDLAFVPPRPVKRHIQFWEIDPDPDATEPNLGDAKLWIRNREWELEEVQARWPDKRSDIEQGVRTDSVTVGNESVQVNNKWTRGTVATGRSRVMVHEFQYQRPMPYVVYEDPETGERQDAPFEDFAKRRDELAAQARAEQRAFEEALLAHQEEAARVAPLVELGVEAEPLPPEPPPAPLVIEEAYNYTKPCWWRCYLLGNGRRGTGVVLERKKLAIEQATIKVDTGYAWKKFAGSDSRVEYLGVIDRIYDAQVWLDRALQTYLEIQSRKAKAPVGVRKGALGKGLTLDQFRRELSKPVTVFEADDLDGIKFYETPSSEPGFNDIYRMCVEAFGFLTGMTQALQGTLAPAKGRAAILVSNLQEQGLQMLLPLREPKTAFTVQMGKLMAALVVKHLLPEDIDRVLGDVQVEGLTHQRQIDPMTQQPVLGPDGEPVLVPIPTGEVDAQGQPVPLTPGRILKSTNILDFDVTVDVVVATPTQKQANWMFWSEHGLLQTFTDIAGPEASKLLLPEIIANSPLPGSSSKRLADEFKALLQQEKKQGSAEGVLQAFQSLAAQDPNAAQQLLAQVEQLLGAGAEPPPETATQ